MKNLVLIGAGFVSVFLMGCSPRVEITPSKEPITINLNIKIDHDVKVRVDRDLDKVISKESGLF